VSNEPVGSEGEEELSKISPAELSQLREKIMADARRTVDPRGTRFDPVMLTDDEMFFRTDDVEFMDWWDWVEQGVRTIGDGFTRLALGVTAGGLAIAASHMYGTNEGSRFAGPTLLASGLMVVWLLVATGAAMRRR
jgi:hypothetical protein